VSGDAVQAENELVAGIRGGDRRALAKAITLVESTRTDHREAAEALLTELLPETGNSIRIGVTGVPGVGKSTFIEAFGRHVIEDGHRIAVLAVDPSSKRSGGSILGDKTRMETLSKDPAAFIRPSPTAGSLGGVARRTREATLLCEAAGFDVILVETVGVGQSETAVADMVDMFLLLLLPGGGDELQGLKRGIMEMADLIVVNKADGDTESVAGRTAAEYQHALRLIRPADGEGWAPEVRTASSLTGTGVAEVWARIGAYREAMEPTGALAERRAAQARAWMWSEIGETLLADFKADPAVKDALVEVEEQVAAGELPAGAAARRLIDTFRGRQA